MAKSGIMGLLMSRVGKSKGSAPPGETSDDNAEEPEAPTGEGDDAAGESAAADFISAVNEGKAGEVWAAFKEMCDIHGGSDAGYEEE